MAGAKLNVNGRIHDGQESTHPTTNCLDGAHTSPNSKVPGRKAPAMFSSINCLNNTEISKPGQEGQQAKDSSPCHRHYQPGQPSQKSKDAQNEEYDVARCHSVGIFIHN